MRHGLRLAAEALRLEDFPMDKQGIDYSVGDIEVDDGRGGLVPIRDLTENFGKREFYSAEEVIRAIMDLTIRRPGRVA